MQGGERVTIEEYEKMVEYFQERYIFLGFNIWNKW